MAMCPLLKAECMKNKCAWWDVDELRNTADCSINKVVELNKILINMASEMNSSLKFIANQGNPRLQ